MGAFKNSSQGNLPPLIVKVSAEKSGCLTARRRRASSDLSPTGDRRSESGTNCDADGHIDYVASEKEAPATSRRTQPARPAQGLFAGCVCARSERREKHE
jgi:hypothetical protein